MRHLNFRLAALACIALIGCAQGETDVSVGGGSGDATSSGGIQGDAAGGTGLSGGTGGTTTGGTGGVSTGGTGGSESGGTGGSSTGGTGGSTTGGTGGAAGTGGTCPTGQKRCGSACVSPAPLVGCSLTDCTPCPTVPPNSSGVCTGGQCDFTCDSGYTKSGSGCVPAGTGGTGGTGGSGGSGGNPGCASGIPCITGQPIDPICLALCAANNQVGICFNNCCACIF